MFTWNIWEHDQDEQILIAEGEIPGVWQLGAPEIGLFDVGLGGVEAEELARHADRV